MSRNETESDNLTLWNDALLSLHELCQLQCLQMGREAGALWQRGEDIRKETLRLPRPLCREGQHPVSVQALLDVMETQQRLAFCRGFSEHCPSLLQESEPPLPPIPPPPAPRVVFWDNYFGREALRRFRTVIPMPRPVTAPSFTAVCEELAEGRADLALLPLGDSREGKMLHLYEEIDRFELHITHTCDIPYPDEGRSICVALLSRLYTPTASVNGDRLLSCRIPGEEAALCDILSAARATGLSLVQIDSRPDPYAEDGRMIYHPTFRVTRDTELFELYLAMCHPRARIIRKYLHLKA